MALAGGEHEGCFLQGVAGDFGALVAGGDEERDDGDAAGESGEVQRGVGFVGEVWVEEEGGVEADEAGDEDGVVEVDGAAEAGGGVDPGGFFVRGVWTRRRRGLRYILAACYSRVAIVVLCNGLV